MFAILDEATSALDPELEALCYSLCADAGITCLSVGHRPSLVAFHQQVVRLGGSADRAIADVDGTGESDASMGTTDPLLPTGALRMHSTDSVASTRPGGVTAAAVPYRFDRVFVKRLVALLRLGFPLFSWKTPMFLVSGGLAVSLAFITVDAALVPGKVYSVRCHAVQCGWCAVVVTSACCPCAVCLYVRRRCWLETTLKWCINCLEARSSSLHVLSWVLCLASAARYCFLAVDDGASRCH